MPICGDEFAFEMTANCLLLPRANGVPTWASDEPGERVMMKLPIQFQTILSEPQPLSETIGEQLAQWAAGGAQAAPTSRRRWRTTARCFWPPASRQKAVAF